MKKRRILPICIGVTAAIVPNIVGFGMDTWQWWFIGGVIILASAAYSIQEIIINK